MADLLAEVGELDSELLAAGEGFATIRAGLADALKAMEEATAWLIANGSADHNDAMAGSTPYLRMFGQLVGGWLLARLALGAQRRLEAGEGNNDFLATKVIAARFYAEQLLPVVRAQLGAVTAGKRDLFEVPAGSFSV